MIGTESRPSEAWPRIPGISLAGVPLPSSSPAWRFRLPGAMIVAGQVPDAGEAGEGVGVGAELLGPLQALAPDLGGGDAGGV